MSTATRLRGFEGVRRPNLWWKSEVTSEVAREEAEPRPSAAGETHPLQDLVQDLFFRPRGSPRVVIVSGIDTGQGAERLCEPLAAELALQAADDVCLVQDGENPAFDECGEQLKQNLWRVNVATDASRPWVEQWQNRIGWLRQEFRYAVIHSPPLLMANHAVVLGRLCDGLLVVLEAHRTRRLAALRAKAILDASGVRLLGTVLSDRTFPIPEAIYRRV